MRRILLVLLLFGIVFSAKIDPEILFLLKTKKGESSYRKGILKSVEPLSQISVLIVTKEKIWNNPITCSDKYCIYGRKVDLASLQKLASDERILSIRLPKKYKLLLWNGIPMIRGNLTNKTVILDEGEYKIPENIFTAFGKNFTGKGVKIAIIDSGIKLPHPWFEDANIIYKAGVYFDNSSGECVVNESDWMDENGHGTHVAGIIHSVAPEAELIILKLLDMRDEDIICAIQKAIELGADIISMSLGSSIYPFTTCPTPEHDPLCYYVNYYSRANNITFIIAAGNEGSYPFHLNSTGSFLFNASFGQNVSLSFFLIRWYNESVSVNITIKDISGKIIAIIIDNNKTIYNITPVYSYPIRYSDQVALYLYIVHNYTTLTLEVNASNPYTEFDIYSLWSNGSNFYFNSVLQPSSGWSTINSPGIAEETITVGSVVSDDSIPSSNPYGHVSAFSSKGPLRHNYSLIKPDIVAPGEWIASANNEWPNGYYVVWMRGTSMATPFVSGVAAIVKQVCPSYTPQEVKEAIIKSAVVAYNLSNYSIYERGYGIVNISKLISEVLPRLVLNISNEVINTTKKQAVINITLKNLGEMPTKLVNINDSYYTLYLENNDNITLSYMANLNLTQAGKYNITLNITGEFVNSPILKNITVYAYSNLSLKSYSYLINNTYMQLNLTLENNADFEPNDCKLILTLDNGSKIVREYSLVNYNVSLNILLNNNAYSGEVSIKCPFNLNKTYRFTTFTLSYSPNYSLFSGAVINLTLPKNATVKVNNSNCSIENSRIVCRLHPGNYTLDIYTEGDIEIHRLVSLEILQPNVSMDCYIKNTRNQRYFGINSTLILNISNNDLNFSGYLVVNGSSEPITVDNETVFKDITKYITNLSEGNHAIKVSLNFSNYFFANLTINLTVDKTLPNVAVNLTNYYPEDNAYYVNKSPISIKFNFTDNKYLSYVEINGTPILNTTEEENGSVINVTTFNLHYGENLINYRIYDLANNSRMGTIKVIYDNITPEIITPGNITNITAFGEIELEFNVIEDYLKNFTTNCTDCVQKLVNNTLVVSLNCTKNMTLRLVAEDKAGNIKEKVVKIFYVNRSKIINIADNRTFDAINKSLIKIESFFANESVKVNISGFSENNWTENVSNGKIRKVEYHINITPMKNATGKLTISVKIPEGYNLANVTLKKPTGNEIANYTVEGDYVKITIDLEDPELIVTFEKTETTSTSTSSTTSTSSSSSGSGFIGGGISGGFVLVPQEYFNVKFEGNKITFERKGIENKTVELNYTYLKNITIIAKEDTGYIEINELNISKILDIVVFKAYEIIPVKCSVILCFERTPVVLFNNRNIQESCVKIDSKSRIIFGRMEIKYKLLENKRMIENKTVENKTREYVKEKEEIKEEKKSPWGWVIVITIIAAIAVVIGRAIILTRRLS